MPEPFDDDETVRLAQPGRAPLPEAASPRKTPSWAIAAPAFAVLLAAAGGWFFWHAAPQPAAAPTTAAPTAAVVEAPVVAPAAAAAPAAVTPSTSPLTTSLALSSPPPALMVPAAPAPAETLPALFKVEAATEQQILNHRPGEASSGITVFRFTPNPRILVLDFNSLRTQGMMLNRVAALTEKAGLPHDRLLSEAALDAAIRAGGDTIETYYYGHDYSGAELVRFFQLADRDDVPLVEEEAWLRQLIRQEGWFEPEVRGGLISIPQVGADDHVTMAARSTILHHELSHGEYFTNPAYAAFTHHFWTKVLAQGERDRIRKHLRSQGYDSDLDEVMENEAQAYLMFTDSPEFFTPEMIGMSNTRLAELRTGFYRNMPPGWLRDSLGQSLGFGKPRP